MSLSGTKSRLVYCLLMKQCVAQVQCSSAGMQSIVSTTSTHMPLFPGDMKRPGEPRAACCATRVLPASLKESQSSSLAFKLGKAQDSTVMATEMHEEV